jgi:hypothetical protein
MLSEERTELLEGALQLGTLNGPCNGWPDRELNLRHGINL